MVRLFGYLKPYRLSSAIALILMLVELFVELYHPILLARIIDEGILTRQIGNVWQWGGLMIGLALFGFICGIVNTYFASHASQSFSFDVREALFAKIQSFSFANFDHLPASTLMTRLTGDMNQIQMAVFLGLRVYLRSPLVIAGSLAMAVMLNARLSLLLLVLTPIVLAVLWFALTRGFRLFLAVQQKLDRTNGVLREVLTGMRLIRAYDRNDHEMKRFERANVQLTEGTIRALSLVEIVLPLLLMLMNVCVLFALGYGNRIVTAGLAPLGEVIAIINYTTRIIASFPVLSMMVNNLSRAGAAVGRVTEIFEAKPEIVQANETADWRLVEGKVEFRNVTFRYSAGAKVLEDVSFTVRPGEFVAIMGAAGSGKSTLLQLLPRLYDPDEGSVLIDGADIRELKLEQLRDSIGYVTQEAILFSGTVNDNLKWGKEDATADERVEAAVRAQIHETIMKLDRQYEAVVGQRGAGLSGGQKQRLSIARALVRNRKLLLLDDCASALDTVTEARLLSAIKSYPSTTLLVTQKISSAREADRILLLDNGRLLAEGTHDQLLAASALYREIFRSQRMEGEEASYA